MKLFPKLLLLTLGPLAVAGAVLFGLFWVTSGVSLRQQAERQGRAELAVEAGQVSTAFQRVISRARLVAADPSLPHDNPPLAVERLRATRPALYGNETATGQRIDER